MEAILNARDSLAFSSYFHASKLRFGARQAEFFASVHFVLTFRDLALESPDYGHRTPRMPLSLLRRIPHHEGRPPVSVMKDLAPAIICIQSIFEFTLFSGTGSPWSVENYNSSGGLLQYYDGHFDRDSITYRNDFMVGESAFDLSLSPPASLSVNANAIHNETSNCPHPNWLDELVALPCSDEDESLFNRAATVHEFSSSAAAACSFSDQWHPELEVDTLRVSQEAIGQSHNELNLPQYCDSSFVNSHDPNSIIHVMGNFHQGSSPDRDSTSALDIELHNGRQCIATAKKHRSHCRTSIFREWLHKNGLRSYPNSDQMEELAVTAGVTVKQARNALSNFRSRMQLKHEDYESRGQMSHTDTCHPTLIPKRKGRRQHLLRLDRTQQTPTAPPSHISSESGLDTRKTHHCTACPKSFENAYGWKRHETGVHGHSDTEWICMLHGSVTPNGECVFCHDHIENMAHFDMHNIHACLKKDMHERTFARKDLLKQHIQQKHLAEAEESVSKTFQVPQVWETEVDAIHIKNEALWCGFCTYMCDSVADCMEHVAEHFRNGYDMDGWVHLTT
ncbi:hypothetical protein HBI56_109320 [Parastagonospora nodorum]|nr:hypothetical protein HBH94_114970 [Parastagonospora nodorum]KAH4680739.1 hypothetical protein HBH80_033720 [Parastagonospora nodorum]KAH4829740.1 hypothetical protein HBH60_085100 [Parastagonospora nodorum]KAH4967468.1 hypothetical protein HBI78_069990 [Parastagonospora nodorum]KAH6423095.1 hypothetical protein HBI08_071830 [Parastagonospora nodorum]